MDYEEKLSHLVSALCSLENEEQCRAFLEDLCTRKELENMSDRIRAAKLLMEGHTYQQVTAQTSVSSATLSRISRCVRYGTGYNAVLKK